MIELSLQAITAAEDKHGSGNGEAKKITALTIVDQHLAEILRFAEQVSNKELVDEDSFAQGVHELNDALVKIMNALHFMPKKG